MMTTSWAAKAAMVTGSGARRYVPGTASFSPRAAVGDGEEEGERSVEEEEEGR